MTYTSGHDWDIYADEAPTQIHHKDCRQTPESCATGDAKAVVVTDPEHYAQEGETFDTSCTCLDPLLGSDRRNGGEE